MTTTTWFPEVPRSIEHVGPGKGRGKDELAFRHYDAKAKVGGKTMEQHLKFAVCFWHTFRGTGLDPFGGPVYDRPWLRGSDAMDVARNTVDAAFEFASKVGIRWYCFHDRDVAPEGRTPAESRKNLEVVVKRMKQRQKETGVRLLWGTANLFGHPRYTHGAATNPDPRVFAHAASQVRGAIDATIELGGTGYVFWGGREGYTTLLNTDMRAEREQTAAFFRMAVDYARRSGFKGMFFLEPKAKEPSIHQYDFDAANCLDFLREFDLLGDFMLNLEANHASLATHSFEHEMRVAAGAGKLGSLDINRSVEGVGWDTDNFPMDLREATLALLVVLEQKGLKYGGLNFDAKVRRGSSDPVDLFHAHVGAMDTWARALRIALRIREDGVFSDFLARRYAGFARGFGRRILAGQTTLEEVEAFAEKSGEPPLVSGEQEKLESLLNDYLYG